MKAHELKKGEEYYDDSIPRYLMFIQKYPELYKFKNMDDNEFYYLTKNEVERLVKI